MENPLHTFEEYEKYAYVEIPQNLAFSEGIFKKIFQQLAGPLSQGKKALICLAPNFMMTEAQAKSLFDFVRSQGKEKILFVSKEGVKWGEGWKLLIRSGFYACEKASGIRMATTTERPGKVLDFFLADNLYIKCEGKASECIAKLTSVLEKSLKNVELKSKILAKIFAAEAEKSKTWGFLHNAVIFDIADLPILSVDFITNFQKILAKYNLNPYSQGVYFNTSNLFQSWVFHKLAGTPIREIGNIFRIFSDKNPLPKETREEEINAILQHSRQLKPAVFLFIHEITGAENAQSALSRFFPEIMLADEIGDANFLKDQVQEELKSRLYNIIPASDPSVRILAPEIITQGYDLPLFAQYILSRYRNAHGSPNETFFYYLDVNQTSLKKVTSFFLLEFAETLPENYTKILQNLLQCEPKVGKQGSFVISVLQQKILSLDITLPWTNQGGATFLANYPEMFSHHENILTAPLRLFIKGDQELSTEAVLHFTEDYNDFFIQQEGFSIECRFQSEKTNLIVKSNPGKHLERRCFGLFALLNSSAVFHNLPDKEILIEIISMLWENYSKLPQTDQGFLITLSMDPTLTSLKIYQSDHNRVLLSCSGTEPWEVSFICDVPYHKDIQRRLLKLVGLFYNQQTPEENTWRFSCFEAISQVAANSISDQKLNIQFWKKDIHYRAVFVSNSHELNPISDRSKKTLQAGAERAIVAEDGRQIELLRNPLAEEETKPSLQQELAGIEADKILSDVEKQKAQEAEERSARFQNLYDAALQSYNEKYGFSEEEAKSGPNTGIRVKSLDDLSKIRALQVEEPEMKQKVRRILFRTAASFLGFFILLVLFFTFMPGRQPKGPALVFRDDDKDVPIPVSMELPPEEIKPSIVLGPSSELVTKTAILLNGAIAPTQEQLNQALKEIYVLEDSAKANGDIYNLVGRIYLYKIHLDREENLFPPKALAGWREEAIEAFAKAESLYSQKKYTSSLTIAMTEWKPEKQFYPLKQSISYASPEEALDDIHEMLRRAKTFGTKD